MSRQRPRPRQRRHPLLTGLLAIGAATAALIPAGAAHAAGTFTLLVLPDQGETQIDNFVNSATRTIDMTMYELRDTTIENDLVAREKAGVKVRVILDGQRTTVNGAAYSTLQSGGVAVTYSSTAFTYTHQKTITVDGATSYVSTGNLDSTYYATSRDYGVFDTDPNDVSAIEAVFAADFAKTSITPADGDDLVWSPTDSQTKLLALINSAQHSLDVEQEEFQDTTLVNAVVAAAQRGVAVRVVAEDQGGKYDTELNQVTAAGGQVKTYSSSTGYYIHAKAIVVDYGTSAARVFQGSENFSDNSLNHNRELGLITADSGVLSGIENAFDADFGGTGGGGGGGGGCTAGQLLGNPGFETGAAAPWTASSGVVSNSTSEPARTGTWDAWMDGYGTTHTDTLAQTISVPSGCTSYSFTFYMHIDSADTGTTAHDTLSLQALSSSGTVLKTLGTYSNLNAVTGYTRHTFTTVSAFAGQTITLRFTATENSSLQTSFVLDDTSFAVS